MLRSRGISQIYYTYSEDMHPIYPPLLWLHTPRLRLGVTTVTEDTWVHILLLGVVYPIHNLIIIMMYRWVYTVEPLMTLVIADSMPCTMQLLLLSCVLLCAAAVYHLIFSFVEFS